jgi:hypothetical protein
MGSVENVLWGSKFTVMMMIFSGEPVDQEADPWSICVASQSCTETAFSRAFYVEKFKVVKVYFRTMKKSLRNC